MGNAIKLDGVDALVKRLNALPGKVERKVLRSAVGKAATPIVRAARKGIKKGSGKNPDGTDRKHLKENIGKRVRTYLQTSTVVAVVGAMGRETPHANIVEGGTVYRVRKRLGGYLKGKGTPHGAGSLRTGRVEGSHFLQNAITQQKSEAVAVLAKGISDGLEKVAKS
jgi:HK97 gp10 family phage protein